MSVTSRLPLEFARGLANTNLDYLINSARNLDPHYRTFGFQKDAEKLLAIKRDIENQGSVRDISGIEELAQKFASAEFNKLHFFGRDLSKKLGQFQAMLDQIVSSNTEEVVNIVIEAINKDTHKSLDKSDVLLDKASRFIETTKDVKATAAIILDAVKNQIGREKRVNLLSITGILLLIVSQRETFVYYLIQSIKKAQLILESSFDIDEICSIESKETQNGKSMVDIVAIRNCISHAAYAIYEEQGKFVVDFRSNKEGFSINRRYSGKQLMDFYRVYDRLIDIHAVLIRAAFLRSILLLRFRT